MKVPSFSDQAPPPPLSTGMVDRINFAIQFEKYRDIVLKRWWIIGLCLSAALAYGGYKAYHQPDLYMARGSMMVRPRLNVQVGDVVGEEAVNFYGTQVRLMQSKQVVESAQAKLQDFAKTFPTPPSASLSVYLEKNTSIFSLSVVGTSAEYARRFLDEVMKGYIAYKKRIRDETTENTATTILSEVDRLDKEQQKAQAELLEFQKVNNMAYFEGQGNMAAQYLVDLKRRLAEVRTEMDLLNTETAEQRLDRERRPEMLEAAKTDSEQKQSVAAEGKGPMTPKNLKSQTDNTSVKNALIFLRAEKEDLSKFLRPKHPRILRIDEEIEKKERLLKIALEQTKDQIAAYRESLTKQEEALQKSMADWEKQALEANQKASQYALLRSNLSRMKELYDVLLKQLQQIDVGTSIDQEMIAVSEPAFASPAPIGPNRTKDVLLAGLYGLLAAIGIIALLERFDDRVKTVEDLQDSLTETVLGQIPTISEGPHSGGPLLIAELPTHNTFSESFRNVRSSLMFSPAGGKASAIAVTSAIPGDGKTTCSVNLAMCLSQIERGPTLLIDADMRKMNVHRYFKMENGTGLSDVLSGQASLEEAIVPSGFPNLDILRAGSAPPNPGELILSENFKALMADLTSRYRRIVIDTPPILATDDTLSLAPTMNGVIFVVKAGQTSVRFVNRSMSLLKQRGATIFGLILNHINTNSAHYYYYYYYSNYYHAESGKKRSKAADQVKA